MIAGRHSAVVMRTPRRSDAESLLTIAESGLAAGAIASAASIVSWANPVYAVASNAATTSAESPRRKNAI